MVFAANVTIQFSAARRYTESANRAQVPQNWVGQGRSRVAYIWLSFLSFAGAQSRVQVGVLTVVLRRIRQVQLRRLSGMADSFYKRALLCPPDHFVVEYKINNWMGGVVDPVAAREQWEGLKSALENYGVSCDVLPQVAGLPDMVFVCNSGLAHNGKVFLSSFRHPQRQAERGHYETWFKDNGFKLAGDGKLFFEGGGDAVFSDPNTLWAGYGQRSQKEVYDEIQTMLGPEVTIHRIPLCHPDYYHLDTCFFPVGANMAVIYEPAFDVASLRLMGSKLELLAVSKEEAGKFACNGLSIGPRKVILPGGCDDTAAILRSKGIDVTLCEMGEFMKSGGACQCLVMKLW